MSQINKVVGTPCNASEGNMNNSEGCASGKPRDLSSGHAKGGSWPSGAKTTGVELNNNPGKHGSLV